MPLAEGSSIPVQAPADSLRRTLQAAAKQERDRKFAEARQLYLAALELAPNDLTALEGAARCCGALNEHAVAAGHWRTVLKLVPARAGVRYSLAAELVHAGELDAAEAELSAPFASGAASISEMNLLGVIQKRRGRLAEAIEIFETAVAQDWNGASSWYNLGNTLLAQGDAAAAVEPLQRAVKLKPEDAEARRVLGHALSLVDRHQDAMEAFARAEKSDPENARIYSSRAAALQRAGAALEDVEREMDRALAKSPDRLGQLHSKVALLLQRNRYDEAEKTYREIIAINPEDAETLRRLAYLLGYTLSRYKEANEILRRALELDPDDPRTLSSLCKSLSDSRYDNEGTHLEEAGQAARKLLRVATEVRPYVTNLSGVFLRLADFEGLNALGDRDELVRHWIDRMNVGALHNQLARVITREDRRKLVYWHRDWGRRVEEKAARNPVRRKPAPARRDKIRLGMMSSDLRDHPVTYFALPIFDHFDKSKFEIFCYSFYPGAVDNVQKFIQERATGFRSMLQATDGEIAQQIADDDLDILFELGGSTRYNRLEVMAYRAAPRQASWLGYPHSAGIGAIDYILVDPFINPDDPGLLVEKPFMMPHSWVSLGRIGFTQEPIEPGLPEDRNGGVLTFGTMNNPYKYTPEIFRLWAECLKGVPGSRFLFVRPEGGAATFCANVRRHFEAHGVAGDRVDFHAVRGKHKPHYNRIDIALDTAPQTGGTTTCEALWMGVPTITLVGEAFFERLSYSNLSNAGLSDLCSFTAEQYVESAIELARDRGRRMELRHGLRATIRRSPLGDSKRWVSDFEEQIRLTLSRN